MKNLLFLLPAAMLAGCVAAAPRPLSVTLTDTEITVPMSDGSTCFGQAPEGSGTTWAGTLTGCATPYRYSVEFEPGTNPVRFVLEEVFGAIGLEGALAPLATVTIVDADGVVRTFASPPSRGN